MAPSKRLSNGGKPGQQLPISSFFSPGKPSTPATTKSQRSISSFFSPRPLSTPSPQNKQKPAMCIGHLQPPTKSLYEGPAEVPSRNPSDENPSGFSDSPSSPPAKRPRVGIESTCNETFDCDPQSSVGERLRVYWPMDDAWYEGRVKSYDKSSKKHAVMYDDGEEEYLMLAEEKIEWIKNEYKINAPPHRFRRLKKLSEKSPADGEDLNFGEKIVKDVSDTDPISSESLKQPLTQHLAEFNNENESSAEDGSDEDWGKNVKDADGTDDNGSEENESFEEEKSVEQKRKRRPATNQKGASGNKMFMKKVDGNSLGNRLKLDSPSDKMQGEVKPIAPAACKPLGSMQENTNGMKTLRQDDDNSLCEKLKTVPDLVSGSGMPITLTGEVAERFGCRMTEKLKFLFINRRDASGKQPEDPGYDPRTLYMPQDFVKGLSGGQRQWWEFKSQHMDKVLFFKMGKFYELFEMDAHIGALELDLQYMKGEQPHCGFPEKNFSENVEKLARKGYRVLVVEQTETPDQLEQRRKATGSKDKVVKREICAVITKGTMTEGGMLDTCPDASYLLAITERSNDSGNDNHTACVFGVCVADASTNRFMLGQFSDDSARSRLCSLLSEIRPVELIKPSGILSKETEKILRDETRKPLVNILIPGKEFWDAEVSLIEIKKLYALFSASSKSRNGATNKAECVYSDTAEEDNKIESLPDVICQVVSAGESGQLALSAFGGCLSYLRQVLLDQSLLSFGKLEILPCSDFVIMQSASDKTNQVVFSQDAHFVEPYMVLDAAALENLEILENNQDGSSSGTLFAQIDHCITGFGKRLLRKWLVRPLMRAQSILERQDAIAEIKATVADSAIKFRKELARLPDMERLLARLYSSSGASGRNAARVVLYEDAAKKQLNEFIAALHGCQCMTQACLSFRDSMGEIKSSLLQHILTPGKGLPDARPTIKHFETAFDWSVAEKTGRILPCEGVDKDYDVANKTAREIEIDLGKHLEMQRKFFGSDMINYVTVGKEQYQIEIPESLLSKVPQEYEARSSRKGFRRFWTPKVKQLLQDLADAQAQREASLRGILQGLIRQFCEHHSIWHGIVKVVAEMDVLISLALASDYFVGPTCRPSIKVTTKLSSDETCTPYVRAKELGHPVLSSLSGSGCFVSNDVNIGGHRNACFMLLTGPNMGGKSTLLRQVCLAVILAQLGADVPAEEFEFSPVDRVFVRMGAKDHIMAGQSTFLVELLETASMLSSATRDSLVVLDELGRGTATSDGQAIAHAVLQHLAHEIGCRGMFSTHYHHLATDYENDPAVGLYHMSCKVGTQVGGLEEVTFLYKLAQGTCPKSYGVNVARLAGMPDNILERAANKSAEFESQYGQRSIKGDGIPLAAIKLKERNLIQEVLNTVEELQSYGTTVARNMKCLVEVWHKVASLSGSDRSHSKQSSGMHLFGGNRGHPLHCTIPPGM